ncbi:MAG TPA: signal peptidase I [Verrucomicrobiae bacterium]|nr:signal peptidase I [Verrucomicrobiae bacterium]
MKRRAKSLLWLAAIGFGLFLVGKFVAMPRLVYGESMSPTLEAWDLCLMQPVYHYQPRRGDIVMFRTADDPPLYFVKRVIALPTETIAIEHGVVTLNGVRLPEPYTTVNPEWQMEPARVPAGKVFVIGDNRDRPQEDYVLGLVATRLVKARLLWHWRWKK